MRLTDTERSVVNDLLAEAHRLATRPDGSFSSRAVPSHFVRLLAESEGGSPGFFGRYLDALALRGAAKVAADWRRSQRTEATTRKGKRIDVPRFGGVRRRRLDGRPEHVQVALPGMTVGDLRDLKATLEKSRNTTSARISAVAALIEVCEERGYSTAEQALADLRGAA
jgi:hypothetical protein